MPPSMRNGKLKTLVRVLRNVELLLTQMSLGTRTTVTSVISPTRYNICLNGVAVLYFNLQLVGHRLA